MNLHDAARHIADAGTDPVVQWKAAPLKPVVPCGLCLAEFVNYNASNVPCDTVRGPCSCGAWHISTESGEPDHYPDGTFYCPSCRKRIRDGLAVIATASKVTLSGGGGGAEVPGELLGDTIPSPTWRGEIPLPPRGTRYGPPPPTHPLPSHDPGVSDPMITPFTAMCIACLVVGSIIIGALLVIYT